MASDDKKERPSGSATEGMGGDGYYDHHSDAQKDGIRQQEARLRNAVAHLDMAGPELRLIDYGCGPGRNSMAAFHIILDEVRRRRPDMPVVAVHNDQIGNDWNDLFDNIRGADGYLNDIEHIRAEASAGSFFGPVASAGVINFGMSFAAAHWLDRPVHLASPHTLFFCDLPQPARGEMAAMADRNWTAFLTQRARELKSGARLVVDLLSSVPDPDDPSGLRAAGRGLYRALWQIADELAGEGRIDTKLLNDFVFPVYFRDSQEARAPLDDGDLKNAFEIIELTNDLLPMPTEDALRQTGDADAYAKSYAGFARAFAESTLCTGLFEGSTSSAGEADDLADDFFHRLEGLFAREPHLHGFDHQVMTLVLRRK